VVAHFRRELPGVEFVEPLGAFYFFFRVDGYFDGRLASAAAFCERLLVKQGVALVPGEAFGDERWVRLSYAASEKALRRALERITEFVRSLETKKEDT
jgi:aspartate aminotransferase